MRKEFFQASGMLWVRVPPEQLMKKEFFQASGVLWVRVPPEQLMKKELFRLFVCVVGSSPT